MMSNSTNYLVHNYLKLGIKLLMATLLSDQTHKTKYYQTNQQVKYLHLEAEVDMLLQKLNVLRQRRQTEATSLALSSSD